MDELGGRPYVEDRLRMAESLLRAVMDSVAPLQRLLAEAHKELGLALAKELESADQAELTALRREVEQLRDGMASRAIIERAKGILMHGHGLTEPESFELLTEMSQQQKRKLRDIAAEVTDDAMSNRLAVVRPTQGPAVPDPRARGSRRRQSASRPGPASDRAGDT
jgi:hypothetical protein